MIDGTVNGAYQAVIALLIRGPSGDVRELDAVVDTGFDRYLTLPPAIVAGLRLPFVGADPMTLADGSDVDLGAYAVTVLWDGEERYIRAYASDTPPLVGMALLAGHRLCMDVEPGGAATIEARA